jgi:hypothetical protein
LTRHRHAASAVLLISGLAGFLVGMLRFPTWQVAVESAQVVAGLVHYPAGNAFFIYHQKLWTILHQICAICLRAGVSEIALSRVLSGILGMVSFQALSLVVYALSNNVWLSVGAAFVIVFSRIAGYGVVYPVFLISTDHTYGALGLSLVVLVVALFAARFSRSGAFFLGLMPAVHPSLGASLWVMMGLAMIWERLALPIRAFVAGCTITALSLVVHLAMSRGLPQIDSATAARYVHAFVGFWDAHRAPVRLSHPGVLMNGFAVALAALWMFRLGSGLPRSASFILRTVLVAGAVSVFCIGVSWIPVDRVPIVVLMLMPARLLNFNVLIYAALLFGLLNLYRTRIWSHLLMIVLAGGLLCCQTSMLWESTMPLPASSWLRQIDPLHVLAFVSLGLLAFGLMENAVERRGADGESVAAERTAGGALVAVRAGAFALLAVSAAATLAAPYPARVLLDRTNDPFFAQVAAERRGLLLTSGTYHLVQLYTRRPVLLDGGGLDSLPYAPESGPAMEQVLRDVYQIDLFHPPPDVRGAGAIPHGYNRPVWERFSLEKWLSIRRAYDVTQVLTRSDYHLDLPIAAENSSFRLYRIPD